MLRFHFHLLQLELCSSPVTSLGVVSDFVSGLHSHPLWDRSIHVHLMSQFTLDDKRLVRSHSDWLMYCLGLGTSKPNILRLKINVFLGTHSDWLICCQGPGTFKLRTSWLEVDTQKKARAKTSNHHQDLRQTIIVSLSLFHLQEITKTCIFRILTSVKTCNS